MKEGRVLPEDMGTGATQGLFHLLKEGKSSECVTISCTEAPPGLHGHHSRVWPGCPLASASGDEESMMSIFFYVLGGFLRKKEKKMRESIVGDQVELLLIS